jgi:hypothetical protein
MSLPLNLDNVHHDIDEVIHEFSLKIFTANAKKETLVWCIFLTVISICKITKVSGTKAL